MVPVPAALKSPVTIVIGLAILALALWGSWIFLRSGGGNHHSRNHPANTTEYVDEPDLTELWSI